MANKKGEPQKSSRKIWIAIAIVVGIIILVPICCILSALVLGDSITNVFQNIILSL